MGQGDGFHGVTGVLSQVRDIGSDTPETRKRGTGVRVENSGDEQCQCTLNETETPEWRPGKCTTRETTLGRTEDGPTGEK